MRIKLSVVFERTKVDLLYPDLLSEALRASVNQDGSTHSSTCSPQLKHMWTKFQIPPMFS